MPGSKLPILGMVIPPLIGNPYNGYINPYYWVDDHPLLYIGSLDPSTHIVDAKNIISFKYVYIIKEFLNHLNTSFDSPKRT